MSENPVSLPFPDVERLLAADRARIARELHDVVTHAVSVMVLQTGAAREMMRQDERRSRTLLESVEASGRQALEELRGFLGLLSDHDGDGPPSAQPGITEIPALIEHVREAGAAVELCVEGQPRAISRGVAVAAYRIVQEALTNVLKHAHGAPTRVILRWSDGALELEIVDHGPRRDDTPCEPPPGRGLTGMRERAATCGGTLDAHPGFDDGYVVRAHIPLDTLGARADDCRSPTTARSPAALRTIFDAQDDIEPVAETTGEPGRGPTCRPGGDPEQKYAKARTGLAGWLVLREQPKPEEKRPAAVGSSTRARREAPPPASPRQKNKRSGRRR